jgi:cholesterol transport system auxiliary component
MRGTSTYIIDPPIGGTPPSETRKAETLRVGFVRVAAPYASSALVYRLGDVRYAADPYNTFVADPGAMLDGRMAEWLDRVGPFGHVIPPGSAQSAPYILEVTVGELYGDFRAGKPPAAVVSVHFVLIDQTAIQPRAPYERTIASRIELTERSPDALVEGYGRALAEILAKVAADLGSAT